MLNSLSKIIDKELQNKKIKYKKSLNTEKNIDKDIKVKYISLPFINDKSEVFVSKIKKLAKEYYPKINVSL